MSVNLEYQVEALRSTVAELQSAGRAKDAELRKLQELADATQELLAGDAQAAKIIDLSKKNRALLLSLEKEKQKSSELQALLKASPSAPPAPQAPQDPDAIEERARALVEKAVEAAEAASKEAMMWREKHQQQTNKMAQLEQKAFGLEIEYKKVVRALVREVGEEVPLAKILDDGSDWKGRREQIIALRDQIKALKASQGLVAEGRHEAATKKNISKISGQRSAEMDRMAAEAAAARQELESTKVKCEAAIARRKVLEAEMASLKEKVAVVLDKSVNDSKLISALRAELATLSERRSARSDTGQDLISENDLWKELGQLRRKLQQRDEQISRQEQIILMLQGGESTGAGAGAGASSAQVRVGSGEMMQMKDPTTLSKLGEDD